MQRKDSDFVTKGSAGTLILHVPIGTVLDVRRIGFAVVVLVMGSLVSIILRPTVEKIQDFVDAAPSLVSDLGQLGSWSAIALMVICALSVSATMTSAIRLLKSFQIQQTSTLANRSIDRARDVMPMIFLWITLAVFPMAPDAALLIYGLSVLLLVWAVHDLVLQERTVRIPGLSQSSETDPVALWFYRQLMIHGPVSILAFCFAFVFFPGGIGTWLGWALVLGLLWHPVAPIRIAVGYIAKQPVLSAMKLTAISSGRGLLIIPTMITLGLLTIPVWWFGHFAERYWLVPLSLLAMLIFTWWFARRGFSDVVRQLYVTGIVWSVVMLTVWLVEFRIWGFVRTYVY